jgi:hypothetical protein
MEAPVEMCNAQTESRLPMCLKRLQPSPHQGLEEACPGRACDRIEIDILGSKSLTTYSLCLRVGTPQPHHVTVTICIMDSIPRKDLREDYINFRSCFPSLGGEGFPQSQERHNAKHQPSQGRSPMLELAKKFSTLLDLCVSSLRRGHANLLCIVPILTDDPRRESTLGVA